MPPKGRNKIPTFPARLAELRRKAGLSQQDLAERAGTSHSAVSALEQGVRMPSLELAGRLADVLGCSTDDFRRPPEGAPGPKPGRGRPRGKPGKK